MKFLFVHQNFPGQYRHVARLLADDLANEVVAIGDTTNLKARPPIHPRIRCIGYAPHGGSTTQTHHYLRDMERHVRRGQNVARIALSLRDKGFRPDVIVAHPGWGESLFLRDVFPGVRLLNYCEYYYHGSGGDVGFDPEVPPTLDDQCKVRVKNATQLLSLEACDGAWSPTEWQRSRYPATYQQKLRVMHEGIDTRVVLPNPLATVSVNGREFRAGEPVVTYVARNLEPYRGFHVFMRMLPELQAKNPQAQVIIVGGDGVSYGRRLPEGTTHRSLLVGELGAKVDWGRVHFAGQLPYADYLRVLQVSAAHVYLTYPFVLSWSMLEAMSGRVLRDRFRDASGQGSAEA